RQLGAPHPVVRDEPLHQGVARGVHLGDGRARGVRAELRLEAGRGVRAHGRRLRRRRAARQGPDLVPEGALRRPLEPPRRRPRRLPLPDRDGFVDTVFPGSFRRSMLEKVGLYDVKAVTNEDAELQQRILQAGGKVYLSKDVVVHYYPRKSFRLLAKQYFKYGDGRARTLLLHKRFPVMRPLIPFLFVVVGATLILVPPL